MDFKLCVIPGDGVGLEVVPAAVRVLEAALKKGGDSLSVMSAVAGWECFLRTGQSVPADTLKSITACGAALFGAVSSPSHKVDGYKSAIVTMRQQLDLYANVRPVKSLPNGGKRAVDLIIFRENTQGLYSGRERLSEDGETAVTERLITRTASHRIARRAFEVTQSDGRKRVTIVHKANVMPVSDGLFRESCQTVAQDFPLVENDELLADIAAMWMLRDPARFDVIVTTNMFGDILSDAAAHWGGGMGLVPSLNWGDGVAVAEPVHGSAPDIAGQQIANPMATVLSAALLARYAWQRPDVATQIERAVEKTMGSAVVTPDLGGLATTEQVADVLIAFLA